MDKGFIKLSRTFFDNEIWQAARAYNESEAWLDLIQSARFEASETCSRFGSCDVVYTRGQYPASIRFLARKWNRSEYWVRSFLSRLIKSKMITTDDTQGITVITLVNYDKYNSCQDDSHTPFHTAFHTPNEVDMIALQEIVTQLSAQQLAQLGLSHTSRTNTKKGKNNTSINKETSSDEEAKKKEVSSVADKSAPVSERAQRFYNSLIPYVEKYGREMVREFYDYWTEMGPNDRKMKFEMVKLNKFDPKRRLATWKRNQVKYESEKNSRYNRRADQEQRESETDNAIFAYAREAYGNPKDSSPDIAGHDQKEIW